MLIFFSKRAKGPIISWRGYEKYALQSKSRQARGPSLFSRKTSQDPYSVFRADKQSFVLITSSTESEFYYLIPYLIHYLTCPCSAGPWRPGQSRNWSGFITLLDLLCNAARCFMLRCAFLFFPMRPRRSGEIASISIFYVPRNPEQQPRDALPYIT